MFIQYSPLITNPQIANEFQFPVTVCIPAMRYEPAFNEKPREAPATDIAKKSCKNILQLSAKKANHGIILENNLKNKQVRTNNSTRATATFRPSEGGRNLRCSRKLSSPQYL
uniref:Putative pogo ele1 orf1-h 1e-40-j 4 n=1 Tax=Ixodes ricinus TaxID=34613 RepID=A0A0K8RE62_IXORI